jgi:hypothetical protein
MTDATLHITPEQADKARALLEKVCALSDGIAVIDQSLRPLKILLEALSAHIMPPTDGSSSNGAEPHLFFAEGQRSDIDRRWIAILSKEGLIEVDATGRLHLLEDGARRIAAVL